MEHDDLVRLFLDEIEEVCRKHGMSISHEDEHGAFVIEEFKEYNIHWLRKAWIELKGK